MNVSSDKPSTGNQQVASPIGQYLVNRPQDAPKGSRRLRWLSVATDMGLSRSPRSGLTPSLGWDDHMEWAIRIQIISMLVVLNIAVFGLNRLYSGPHRKSSGHRNRNVTPSRAHRHCHRSSRPAKPVAGDAGSTDGADPGTRVPWRVGWPPLVPDDAEALSSPWSVHATSGSRWCR